MTALDATVHVPAPAVLMERRELTGDTSLIRIAPDPSATGWLSSYIPGQFIQLSVPGAGEIPVSLADMPRQNGIIELCIRRVGHVTDRLKALVPGNRLGVRGPFGVGFPVQRMKGSPVLLLAGGLGIAPLRSLLYYLVRNREEYGEITLLYGAKEIRSMLFRDELAELALRRKLRLYLTVDFAPQGPTGDVECAVGLLPDLLKGFRFEANRTYAAVCGPPAVYRCLASELEEAGVAPERILLSLERRMCCGIGRCCHCAVGQLLCCTDGPVFPLSVLRQIPEAL